MCVGGQWARGPPRMRLCRAGEGSVDQAETSSTGQVLTAACGCAGGGLPVPTPRTLLPKCHEYHCPTVTAALGKSSSWLSSGRWVLLLHFMEDNGQPSGWGALLRLRGGQWCTRQGSLSRLGLGLPLGSREDHPPLLISSLFMSAPCPGTTMCSPCALGEPLCTPTPPRPAWGCTGKVGLENS